MCGADVLACNSRVLPVALSAEVSCDGAEVRSSAAGVASERRAESLFTRCVAA